MQESTAFICLSGLFALIGRGVEVRHVAYGNFRLDRAGRDRNVNKEGVTDMHNNHKTYEEQRSSRWTNFWHRFNPESGSDLW